MLMLVKSFCHLVIFTMQRNICTVSSFDWQLMINLVILRNRKITDGGGFNSFTIISARSSSVRLDKSKAARCDGWWVKLARQHAHPPAPGRATPPGNLATQLWPAWRSSQNYWKFLTKPNLFFFPSSFHVPPFRTDIESAYFIQNQNIFSRP